MLIKYRNRAFLFEERLDPKGREYVEMRYYKDEINFTYFIVPAFAWIEIKDYIVGTTSKTSPTS